MRIKFAFLIFFILLFQNVLPQDSIPGNSVNNTHNNFGFSGFIRGGFYTWTEKPDNKLYVPDAFSDLGLKFETGNGSTFRAMTELRYRYGAQFGQPVSKFDLREGFIELNGNKWSLTAGQKIIRWGRADFTNPTSNLSPRDLLFRSPDREDMYLGNLLSSLKWFPSSHIGIEAVIVPFYRPSTLIIDPVPLPSYVSISRINSILTGSKYTSYGLKADFHVKGSDYSISWFDGYDPMPGIALASFSLGVSEPPVPSMELAVKPYRTRVAGADFETSLGRTGIRGEAAWSIPYSVTGSDEYIPLPEIKWVAGIDWFTGNWHFVGEYYGKYVTKFTSSAVEPLISKQPDISQLSVLLSNPGFDPGEYVRQQVAAFNRLFNYQLERYNHVVGFRIEGDLDYGRLSPSLFSSFNLTSRDLLVIPEIRFKPSDGLTLTAGAELYTGRKGSLFDLVNEFMDGVYISLRADF